VEAASTTRGSMGVTLNNKAYGLEERFGNTRREGAEGVRQRYPIGVQTLVHVFDGGIAFDQARTSRSRPL